MKAQNNPSKVGVVAPKKGEARTAPTVSGPKITSSSNQCQHSKATAKDKGQDSCPRVIAHAQGKRIGPSEYVTPVAKVRALKAIRDEMPGNSSVTQERRALEALSRLGNLTTFEGSRYIDCYDIRARVMSLRNKGHNIITTWVMTRTECGRLHRIGIYTLQRGARHATR